MHEPKPGKYTCTRCKKKKDLDSFYLDTRKKSGVSSWCKKCSLEVAKATQVKKSKDRENEIHKMQKMHEEEV